MNKLFLSCLLSLQAFSLFGDNQTVELSPVLPPTSLPFTISIDLTNLTLPNGWHSGAYATWGNKCLLVAGRTNGLHGFDNNPNVNNFPPSAQNTALFVIDFEKNTVATRLLTDPASGLTQEQIDILSVTSPQFFSSGQYLYITGGYGINTATGQMETKSTLSELDIPGVINWVVNPNRKGSVASNLRQTSHPILQVTGGEMGQASPHLPVLLVFGQNFTGFYDDNSNGDYTKQIRTFRILTSGKDLYIAPEVQFPQDPAYRRRDLNVVPVMRPGKPNPVQGYIAFSGVFTETSGIWTVPVIISQDGSSFMPDPTDPATFKQAMNNYASATAGLYSSKTSDMYVINFGGLTFGYFQNGQFLTDPEIPFTNEVTTIKIDKNNVFSQYLMDNQFPTIISTSSNPGNVLLFGTGGEFVVADNIPTYRNRVIALDRVNKGPVVIGYIVGGIQSTVPNTNSITDSAASPYIFKVTLSPR